MNSLPTVTVQAKNRILSIASHAIDVLVQNLDEVHTREEKRLRKTHPLKFIPIDVRLNDIQVSLNVKIIYFVL